MQKAAERLFQDDQFQNDANRLAKTFSIYFNTIQKRPVNTKNAKSTTKQAPNEKVDEPWTKERKNKQNKNGGERAN